MEMSHEYDYYSKEFQSRILASLIHYPDHPDQSLPVIGPSYLTLPMHSQIALAIHKAYDKKRPEESQVDFGNALSFSVCHPQKK
jgi:hypothetical protein